MRPPRTVRQACGLGLPLTVVLLLASALPTRGQVPMPTAPGRTDASPVAPGGANAPSLAVPVIEEEPLIYVPDAQGNLVPMINVPLAKIQRLLDQQEGLLAAQQPPAFQLNQLSIQGTAREHFAELDVEIEVTVLTPETGEAPAWTALPLRFHDASLLAPPEHTGDGKFYLEFDSEAGYQGWLRHTAPGDHRLKLKFAVPLAQVAESTQLRFYPPLANRSQLQLAVSGAELTADAENARNVTVEPSDVGQSLLRAEDLRNQVAISWRQGRPSGIEPPTYLDVRGDVRVTIDGPGAIRSSVILDLQSYGQPIEQFRLRLPPNTKIVSGNQPGYSISELSNADAEPLDRRATVQIKLEKPALQARIQLATQTTDQAEIMTSVNVASFEVLSAIRQSGRISLLTSEEWRVYWTLGRSVRRVQSAETFESTPERKLLASFQYFRQPCRLDVQINAQESRIGVEPAYRMQVFPDRVTLEAQLNYKIRGARASFLDFALNGWQLDEVGPSGTVENDDFPAGGVDPVKLRLSKATSGDLSLTLSLHRPIEGRQGTLRFPLPWPRADAVSPGTLFVSSADSVVLNYRLQEMNGLVQDPLLANSAPPLINGESSQAPTAFRFMTDRTLGEFVTDYEVRSQEMRVRADTVMELSTDTAQITQRLAYRILYEPTARLQLEVPRKLYDLWSNPKYRNLIEFRLDGQILDPDALQDVLDGAEDKRDRDPVPLSISLERARLGAVNLELRFTWPMRPLGTAEYTAIPIVTPRDTMLVSNTASLTTVGPLRVEPADDGDWLRDDDVAQSNALQAVGMTTPHRPNLLRVRVAQRQDEVADEAPTSATVIELAWLQTWLSAERRMDRAVYRMVTGAEVVLVTLPDGVEQFLALVDGVQAAAVQTGNELLVPLPRSVSNEHTLELSLSFTERPPRGKMSFQAPTLMDAVGPRRWFWQLLVPKDEHLVVADPQLTSANRWIRRGWFWRRATEETQSSLERWTGASQQPSIPEGLNDYLFSSFDHIEHLDVRTCSRRSLVYGTSTLALGLGLALLYWPMLRHPALLLMLAATLLTVGWLYTDMAILISQASLLGVLLALVATLTWVVLRQWGGRVTAASWIGPASDSRSGVTTPWTDGSAPHSTISATGPPVAAMAPDSKA